MTPFNTDAQKFTVEFIKRHKDIFLDPKEPSESIHLGQMIAKLEQLEVLERELFCKEFSLNEIEEVELLEYMKENGLESITLPCNKLLFTQDGLERFLAICKDNPAYIEVKEYLLMPDSPLDDLQRIELYNLFYNNRLAKKRGPKKKTYLRTWLVYRLVTTLKTDYNMPAYSSSNAPNPDVYAVDFIFDKLLESGINCITRDEIINDYKKYKKLVFG